MKIQKDQKPRRFALKFCRRRRFVGLSQPFFDGLGRLGYLAIVNRDYPIVFATLYIFSLMGLVVGLISDLIYTWIDPRIDFDRRDV